MKKYLFLVLAFLCVACSPNQSAEKGKKPLVLVSVPPYISIVEAIAGDTVRIHSAVAPGFDSHTNEVTPKEARMIQECSLWIGIGEPYEKKLLTSLLEAKRNVPILQLNESMQLLSFSEDANFVDACVGTHLHDHSEGDLHIWMSPRQLKPQAEQIYEALATLIPENREEYHQNLDRYIDKLQALNAKISSQLGPYQKKGVIVSHPFLGYLCYDYHLYQIAVECEGKAPRAQSINQMLTLAKNYGALCVFTSPQYNNKGALLFAEKLGLKTYEVDPLGIDPLKTIEQVVNDITR